jgi:FkbM family methyltransferase
LKAGKQRCPVELATDRSEITTGELSAGFMKTAFLRKLSVTREVTKTYQNWPLWFLDRLGVRLPTALVRVKINGANLEGPNNSETWGTIDQIWRQKIYTKYFPILEGFKVLDIGAHFGFFSVFAAFQGRNVKVVSYEPSGRNFRTLQKNIILNGKDRQILAFNHALSDIAGNFELYKSEGHDDSGSLIKENLNAKNSGLTAEIVQVEPASEIWKSYERYDFVKIDCEGSEYSILKSLGADIKRFHYLAVEYHGDSAPITELLSANGFTVLSTSHGDSAPWCAFLRIGMLYAVNPKF